MRLPIRNSSDRPLTIFIEPWCTQYEVPVGGEAIIDLEDGRHPHSIDVQNDLIAICDESGSTEATVEIVSEEQQSLIEALRLIRTWLYRLDAKDVADALKNSIVSLERSEGYLRARANVFGAFHSGFQIKEAEEPPRSEALPRWSGNEALAAAYAAGETAAYLNHLNRSHPFPGFDRGCLDTDTVRSAFERAAAVSDALRWPE